MCKLASARPLCTHFLDFIIFAVKRNEYTVLTGINSYFKSSMLKLHLFAWNSKYRFQFCTLTYRFKTQMSFKTLRFSISECQTWGEKMISRQNLLGVLKRNRVKGRTRDGTNLLAGKGDSVSQAPAGLGEGKIDHHRNRVFYEILQRCDTLC